MVHTELFDQLDTFLNGSRIVGCTQCTQRVVVGIAFQQHFLSVEQKSLLGSHFHGADAEA